MVKVFNWNGENARTKQQREEKNIDGICDFDEKKTLLNEKGSTITGLKYNLCKILTWDEQQPCQKLWTYESSANFYLWLFPPM